MKRFPIAAVLTAAMAAALALPAAAQERQSPTPPTLPKRGISALPVEVRQRADGFFALLRMQKVNEAYGQLFDGSEVAKEAPETVTELVRSTMRLVESSGEIGSAEFLRARFAGKTLIETTYLVNGRKRPVRWRIYFYFTDGAWRVLDTDVATKASGFFDAEPADDDGAR